MKTRGAGSKPPATRDAGRSGGSREGVHAVAHARPAPFPNTADGVKDLTLPPEHRRLTAGRFGVRLFSLQG
jgi:hypothetical protein